MAGCQTTNNFSTNLIDEELLSTTTVNALDSKKDEFLEKLREEVEIASDSITADLNERVVQELMDRVDKTLVSTTDRLVAKLDESTAALNKKHEELLGRLPLYALVLVIIVWGASVIDDIFRWLVGKPKVKK